jgi:hypothetical protein
MERVNKPMPTMNKKHALSSDTQHKVNTVMVHLMPDPLHTPSVHTKLQLNNLFRNICIGIHSDTNKLGTYPEFNLSMMLGL